MNVQPIGQWFPYPPSMEQTLIDRNTMNYRHLRVNRTGKHCNDFASSRILRWFNNDKTRINIEFYITKVFRNQSFPVASPFGKFCFSKCCGGNVVFLGIVLFIRHCRSFGSRTTAVTLPAVILQV
ncbi:hypothetical protein ALC56_01642 [Trachymyrmex septentrionalis]|uniref:Uncharacterized protein n=1 Tax=Trachymyrmex septentrionalis TaxID=34720 RepID=A0A195FUD7_9HYME|nr:hypothetical protein ALC56_01642 [Trachymyrmex septentrionalis]